MFDTPPHGNICLQSQAHKRIIVCDLFGGLEGNPNTKTDQNM